MGVLIFFVAISALVVNACASSHFVLVHGAGQGAWCWYKVTTKLQHSGHQVDALDLASAGIDNRTAASVGTLQRYTAPLLELLSSLPSDDKVVLVGSSLAGLSLTLALETFPDKIAAAVYVAALMLPSGPIARSLFDTIFSKFEDDLYLSASAATFRLERVQHLLYNKSPLEDVVLSKTLLKPFPLLDPTVNFTNARYGSVPRYFIRTSDDHTLLPAEQEELIARTPPRRVLMLKSDHSPFFSQLDDLVSYLVNIGEHKLVPGFEH